MRGEEPVAVESASRRPGLARLFAVLAVLVGLFLMHGAPTAAMGDCHDSMALTLPGTHSMAVTAQTAAGPSVQTQRQSETASGSQGSNCVTTPIRGHLTLPAAPVLAFAVLLATAVLFGTGRLGGARSARRRGPPPTGGRQLLLQVCIART